MRYIPVWSVLCLAMAVMPSPALFAGSRGTRGGGTPALPGGRAGQPGVGLAGSEANLAAANTKLDDDKAALAKILDKMRKDFDSSADNQADLKAVETALAAENDAKAKVLELLKKKPEYVTAKQQEAAAQAAMDAAGPNASADRRSDLSTALMQKSNVTSRMEGDAFKNDFDYQAADKNLKAARDAAAKLKSDFEAKLPTDPDVVAAQKKVDDDQAASSAWEGRVNELRAAQSAKGR